MHLRLMVPNRLRTGDKGWSGTESVAMWPFLTRITEARAPLPAPERSLMSRCTNLSPSATNTPHPRWECWAFIVR